jgi:triphosphoribosyl-dephospho-CoA synthase
LQRIGRAAVSALYDELALAPKPGLVSFQDAGSHTDMDARSFMRSLFALRHSFPRMAWLGAAGAEFAELEREGLLAEGLMMRATGGVNTHRGAIFSLGLLCASAGSLAASGEAMRAEAVRLRLTTRWGAALAQRGGLRRSSNGAQVADRLGLRSANAEAASGFPVLFESTLPALRRGLARGHSPHVARLDALFHTLAVLDDTNLAHRGGLAGLSFAQRAAASFLDAGGAARPEGRAHASRVHAEFVARGLSPGGSADLLAAACWLQRVCAFA